MRILERYINFAIIKIFFSTVFVFAMLYFVIDVTSQIDEFIDRKVPFKVLVRYYFYFFPTILVQTSSIACLISVLFTFSNLSNNNEIIAMRTSGLNFWQITKPALIFGLIISAMVFWVSEVYIPKANEITRKIRDDNMILQVDRIRMRKEQIKNLTFYGLKNRLYFIDTYNPEKKELKGITIIEHDQNQNIKQKIVALKGVWTGIAWKFYQCQVTTYDGTDITKPTKVKRYEEKLMDIKETPTDFMKQRLNVSAMNIRKLNAYIDRFSNSGAKRALNNLKVDLHQKIAYPFGNFVIVLVGLPFALMVRNGKGATFTSLGIAIGIGFLYYVFNAVFLAFGKGGALPPILSAWMAPIIFISIGLYAIKADYAN